ncbi:hypothetical protein JCM3774_000073 [Rhodotorula dairenensis]
MTASESAYALAERTLEATKANTKAKNAPVAFVAPLLIWADKTPPSVQVSPRTPYPPVRHPLAAPSRGPSPRARLPEAPPRTAPVAPPRPRRPDSVVEDGEPASTPPAYDRIPAFSPIADLGLQLEDIISTYMAEPTPDMTAATPDPPHDPLGSKREGTAASTDTHAAINAALADLGLDKLAPKPSSPVLPGSERARRMLSLRQRTLHLSSLPGYGRRIDLLQKLEVSLGAFMSIEDAEAILCIEAPPPASQKGPEYPPRSDVRGIIGRVRTSWRPKPRIEGASRPVVVGVPLNSLPSEAFVTATIAGRPYDLPILCFAAVEEIYRRGQGPAVKNFLEAAGSITRRDQLVGIYEEPGDYGERHDLSLESIHDVVALLKHYLTALPTPLLDDAFRCLFMTACVNSRRPLDKRIESAQLILRLLPTKNFNLFLYLAAGFSQIPLFPKNAVAVDGVASIFGEAVFGLRTRTQRAATKRFGVTISAPNGSPFGGEDQAVSSGAALRWLLMHWPEIAEGLLVVDAPPKGAARPISTETLAISTAPVSPNVEHGRATEGGSAEQPAEPGAAYADKQLPIAPRQAPTNADRLAPPTGEAQSEPALSPSSSARTSPSIRTPPATSSPLLSYDEEGDTGAALRKQLDDAIAMLTVRRPSAGSADNASIYAFPPPPPPPEVPVQMPATVIPDPAASDRRTEDQSPQFTRVPIGLGAHRRSQSDNVSRGTKSTPPPLLRCHSTSRVRLAQAPSILTPPILEDDSAVPPPVPQKRQSIGASAPRSAPTTGPPHRHSIASPARPGTKNFLLPAHARRYDEIIHLRQRLSALEQEREAERADMAKLRSELALFKAKRVPRPDSEEQSRVAEAERRAVDAETRADRAEKSVASLRGRMEKVETAKRREAAEAKQTATDLEMQLRSLRDLVCGQHDA